MQSVPMLLLHRQSRLERHSSTIDHLRNLLHRYLQNQIRWSPQVLELGFVLLRLLSGFFLYWWWVVIWVCIFSHTFPSLTLSNIARLNQTSKIKIQCMRCRQFLYRWWCFGSIFVLTLYRWLDESYIKNWNTM